jgi:2-C-methyl-D-erythritol 4-phosphate cytidylyltransferase
VTTAIIVAGGSGERLPGAVAKQLLDLGGVPVLEWSVRAFESHAEVDRNVVVLPAEMAASPPGWLVGRAIIVAGGATRAESVACGVEAAGADAGALLVHDAVRPFVSAELISRVLASARAHATVPVVPVTDTIKRVDDAGWVASTPVRSELGAAQTPQGFPAGLLQRLAAEASGLSADLTDEGVLCERAGVPVRTVRGDAENLKITNPTDLAYARWLVESGVITVPILP